MTPTTHQPAIIALANQKGGVAKTTTVVSLGGALAELGQETLLIDLDPQANLTLAMGMDPTSMHGSIADILLSDAALTSVSRETSIPGLDLVPSNAEMELAERFLPVRQNYETILQQAIYAPAGLGSGLAHYDFILLDCPPAMGAVTLNALTAAHTLIIPTQPEYFSAHALRAMMSTVRQVRKLHNPTLNYRVLITLLDRRNRIHRHLSQQIRATFTSGLLESYIQIDTQLRESAVVGQPITHYRPKSRSALQYRQLAQELIQYVKQKTPRTGTPIQRSSARPA